MYCSNCGTENNDNSSYCSNCGKNLSYENITERANISKTNLFSAHLLNIISFCLPVLMILAMFFVLPHSSSTNSSGGGDVSVHVEGPSFSAMPIIIALVIGLVIFIIGLMIYLKPDKTKLKMAYAYLFLAIADLVFAFFGNAGFVFMSCGMGTVMFIPGILQVVAGTKFLKAIKEYAI